MRRRTLLLAGAGAAGALVVGFAALPPRSRLGRPEDLAAADGAIGLNGWIQVLPDGGVRLAMPRSEMGQGVHTALAMLAAEELDLPLARLTLVDAGGATIYGNVAMFLGALPLHPRDTEPGTETLAARAGVWTVSKLTRELGIQVTGGSSSMADLWLPLRSAAATARARLLGAASLRWRQPVAEMTVTEGLVRHPSGVQAHYGELADAASRTPASDVALKPRAQWSLIGQPAPRLEAAAKTDGTARFGIDIRLPGMLHAVVRHAPALGGAPGRVDPARTLALPGVERVVHLRPFAGSTAALAVVGRTTWHARRGAVALDVDWMPPPAGAADSDAIARALRQQAAEAHAAGAGTPFHTHGDAAAALPGAARRVRAEYFAPYLAHVPMEPINATAQVTADGVTVWAPTQVPGLARRLAAEVAGVPEAAVTVHTTLLGGGFGRRLDIDFIGQAVRVAMDCGGRPVQLLWPREEDLTHDFYRPAGAAVMEAGFDANGALVAWSATTAGDAVTPRWMARTLPALAGPVDLPDKTASEGMFDVPYGVPHRRVAHLATHHGVPVGYWRAVGHSHNAFFCESFIDELAHAAGADPVAFRLARLDGLPRHAAVLRLAAERAGWGTPPPAGRARGVALHESFGSIVAEVVEVSAQPAAGGPQPRVHRVVCAVDCGTVVNPQLVAQQVESGVLFGLAAALWGGVRIVDGVVQQRNLPDHPLVTLAQTPTIETHLVDSEHPPTGMGEPGLPPLAPALANAWFALTGQRRRDLPLLGAPSA